MKNARLFVLTCVLSLVLVTAVSASAQSDIPRISIAELKSVMDKKTPVIIIDVQPAVVYAEGHIRGAISLPAIERIRLEDVWDFPYDRLIVTYCDCGPGESDSADAAAQLMKFGFDQVKVLADPAIKGWKDAKYPVEKGKGKK